MATFNGTLTIKDVKKGKELSAVYLNHNGKEVKHSIHEGQRHFTLEDAKDGDPIIITTDAKNQIAKVTLEGKEESAPTITIKNTIPHNQQHSFNHGINKKHYRPQPQPSTQSSAPLTAAQAKLPAATAPYNFIPQNCVLWLNEDESSSCENLYSGTITCTLKALRPLLVSGANLKKNSNNSNAPADKYFFKVNDCPTIPGSSLKGMLRSLIEILSCSALAHINERKLFWRNIDDKDYYMPKMVNQQAGFLVREGANYFIEPVKFNPIKKNLTTNNTQKKSNTTLVCTGAMPKKKHDYDFETTSSAPRLPVADDIIKNFLLQLTPQQVAHAKQQHSIDVNKLKSQDRLPVFYVSTNDRAVDFFGLAKFFRYPTQNTVKDLAKHLIKNKEDKRVDFAARLFGYTQKETSLCGRISIQAASFPKQSPIVPTKQTVLGQPHETCIAHYLVQDLNKVRVMPKNSKQHDIKTMSSYNTGGNIRGRKMYWHRDVEEVPPPKENKKVACILHPLKEGVSSTFTIHLHNITKVELGAIVEALALPKGHAHKLGMGKALGLGSVRLDIADFKMYENYTFYADITNRCYEFFNLKSEASPQYLNQTNLENAKNAFRLWVLHGLGKTSAKAEDFENLEHIKSLRYMMDFENRPHNKSTKNMDLEEFKKKHILNTPEQIYTKK